MLSKRFLIVPPDSSAARMPLPGATMARATSRMLMTDVPPRFPESLPYPVAGAETVAVRSEAVDHGDAAVDERRDLAPRRRRLRRVEHERRLTGVADDQVTTV